MGTVPVKIDELGFGFEAQNDEHASWLHRPTGRIVILETLLLNRLKDDDETDARLSFADIVDEDLPHARAIAAGDDASLPLPTRYNFHPYAHTTPSTASFSTGPQKTAGRWRKSPAPGPDHV